MAERPTVGVVHTAARYPREAPFHPHLQYPEYPFGANTVGTEPNAAYDGVRRLFLTLGLDAARAGTAGWNPLGTLVQPGMTVVIKPNFVLSRHKKGGDLWSIITHPSVLRAVADYVWIALHGRGRIVIADAPQYDCDFSELRREGGLDTLIAFFASQPGPAFEVRDLRRYWSRRRHQPSMLEELPGDPEGTVRVNLGGESCLANRPSGDLYGASYLRGEVRAHHTGARQEYDLSGTMLRADAVISVPKLKVHKKVGVTLNAKGLVGVCTNKNLLVHYTLKPPSAGGDQYPDGHFTPMEERLVRLERWMYDHLLAPELAPLEWLHRAAYWLHGHTLKPLGIGIPAEKRKLDAGNWHGNDSAWRMTADLMQVFHFADRDGRLRDTRQRRTFSIIDGVVGGEGEGPLTPDRRESGVLIGGDNLLATDLVATRLMGFDPWQIRTYAHLLTADRDLGVRDPAHIDVRSDTPAYVACLSDRTQPYLNFAPHPGWVGAIEVARQEAA